MRFEDFKKGKVYFDKELNDEVFCIDTKFNEVRVCSTVKNGGSLLPPIRKEYFNEERYYEVDINNGMV